jgi:predicted DNA-binding transcriptional regulator YafY
VLAWCCLRQDFRRFHLHKIAGARLTGAYFRPGRVALLRRFLTQIRADDRRQRPGG